MPSQALRDMEDPRPCPLMGGHGTSIAHVEETTPAWCAVYFVADVCLLTEGRAALVVALYIFTVPLYRVHGRSRCRVGTEPSFGVGRSNKQKALIQLKAARLIAVKTSNGRTAEVTLRWKRGRADRRL